MKPKTYPLIGPTLITKSCQKNVCAEYKKPNGIIDTVLAGNRIKQVYFYPHRLTLEVESNAGYVTE